MTSIWLLLVSLSVAQLSPAEPTSPFESTLIANAVNRFPPTTDEILPVSAIAVPSSETNGFPPREVEPAVPLSGLDGTPWGVTTTWLSPQGAAGFGIVDLGINRIWTVTRESPSLFIVTGVGAHLFNGPSALDLPATVYDVYLDLSCRILERERSGVTIGVTPGVYGDMERFDGRSFQVTGRVMGDFQINARWTIVGGVAVVRQLRSHWLPVGGVIWTPHDDWQVDLIVPRPRIARRLLQTDTTDLWGYVAGQFGGGSWAVDDGTGRNVLLGYSDLRLLAGANLWRGSGRELTAELGYVFSRDLAVSEQSIFTPDNSWVAQFTWVF